MKLYYFKGACSLAPRIIINELGLDCEYESINKKTKCTESGKDFLLINPKGSVPVLETNDGKILTENGVILQYLADSNSAYHLLPKIGEIKRYLTLEWVNYVATELHKSFGPLFNPSFDQKLKDEIFIPLIKGKLNYVNKQLTGKFLLGDEFSLADAYLFVILSWIPHFKLNMQEWPNLHRYYNQLIKREAIAKSLQQEGLETEAV